MVLVGAVVTLIASSTQSTQPGFVVYVIVAIRPLIVTAPMRIFILFSLILKRKWLFSNLDASVIFMLISVEAELVDLVAIGVASQV